MGTSGTGTFALWAIDLVPGTAVDRGAVVGSTVTRIRASLEIVGAELTGAVGGCFVGVAVIDMLQFTDGAAPPIHPYADMNAVDWMYWHYFPVAEMKSLLVATTRAFAVEIDVKSQRRLSAPSQTPILIMENNSIAATTGANIVASTLLKLS